MPLSTLDPPRPTVAPAAAPGMLRRRLSHPSVFLAIILTAQLMVVLDTTIVNVALPHIQRGLGFSGTQLSWVINAYILTFGGLLLLGARSGDLIGRRRTFLLGIALFSASSLVGGLAAAGWMLLAARAVQGAGAALAAPSALSLLTTVFPEGPARVRAIALYTTMSAAGGAIGLVAGGVLTQFATWRWVMFVNVPIGLAVWFLGRATIVETERRRGHFDVAGAVTSTVGMGAIVLGLVEAGTEGWGAPITLISLVLGVLLVALFVVNERRAEEPILPLRLLTNVTRSSANGARALAYAGMYGMFFFLSQFFQDVQHFSPVTAGLAFLPMPLSVFAASQLTSRVLVRRFPSRAVMMSGIVLAALGLIAATQLQSSTPYAEILVWLVLVGAGSGISFVSLTSASLADVDMADAGAASGLVNVSQQLGAALGLAVLVSAFGAFTGHVQLEGPGGPATAHAVTTLVSGIDKVFGLAAVFALAALVAIAVGTRPRRAQAPVIEIEMEGASEERALARCATE